MTKISRKAFFKGLAVGTISLPIALRGIMGQGIAQDKRSANVITDKKYNWKMVTTWPPNFPIIGESCERFARLVNEMSGGRIEIRVYSGGELVPALESFDAVSNGAVEMGHGAGYYWAGKVPAAQFFATVPFGMNAQQMNAWLTAGGGLEMWQELYKDFNLAPMPCGNSGVQMGGWFNREINGLEDLKGLKMRIPGLGGKVLEKAGGAPVLLAGGEIYTGLERGVIDATEFLGPFHDYLMGFHEIAKYYYTPGWHEPGTVLELIVNKEKYDALPKDLQAIIRSAAAHVNNWTLSEMEAKNAATFHRLLNEEKIDVRTFPPDIMEQLRNFTNEVIAEITAQDAFARKVYASYDDFRKKAREYSNITEKIYYDQIQLS